MRKNCDIFFKRKNQAMQGNKVKQISERGDK